MLQRRQPKLPYFGTSFLNPGVNNEKDAAKDYSDRLPHVLVIRNFDIFCFLFSAASYLADICSDAVTAYIHYREQRMWAFIFIAMLTVLPSVLLNIVSFLWWIDDVSARTSLRNTKADYSKLLLFRIVTCLLQVSPVLWYLEAAVAAVRFRLAKKGSEKLCLYITMVEAERDASLLRFFEAFLESAPQMVVQGVVLAQALCSLHADNAIPKWMLIQLISLSFSLLSSCWSFVIQHRSLRISRPDKENITPIGALIQLLWRIFTVCSRWMCFVLFILAYHYWIMAVFAIHYMVSVLHIVVLQPLEIGSNWKFMETGLVAVCAAVHLFAPYNMVEGRSRYRYIVAYCIEAIEIVVLMNMVMGCEHYSLPYKRYLVIGTYVSFLLGIMFMLIYYGRFHPNLVRCSRIDVQDSCTSLPYPSALSPLSQEMEKPEKPVIHSRIISRDEYI